MSWQRIKNIFVVIIFFLVTLLAPQVEIVHFAITSNAYASEKVDASGGNEEISKVFGPVETSGAEDLTNTFVTMLILLAIGFMALLMIEKYDLISVDGWIFIAGAVIYIASEIVSIVQTINDDDMNFKPEDIKGKDVDVFVLEEQKKSYERILVSTQIQFILQTAAAAAFGVATGFALSQYIDLKKTCAKMMAAKANALLAVSPAACTAWAAANYPPAANAQRAALCNAIAGMVSSQIIATEVAMIGSCNLEDVVPGASSQADGTQARAIINTDSTAICGISGDYCPLLIPGPEAGGSVYLDNQDSRYYVYRLEYLHQVLNMVVPTAEAQLIGGCTTIATKQIASFGSDVVIEVAGNAIESVIGDSAAAGASLMIAEAALDRTPMMQAREAAACARQARMATAALEGQLKGKFKAALGKALLKAGLGVMGGPITMVAFGASVYFSMRDLYSVLKIVSQFEWFKTWTREQGIDDDLERMRPIMDTVLGLILIPGAPCVVYGKDYFWEEGYYVLSARSCTLEQENVIGKLAQSFFGEDKNTVAGEPADYIDSIATAKGKSFLNFFFPVAEANLAGIGLGVGALVVMKVLITAFAPMVDAWIWKPLGRTIIYGSLTALVGVAMGLNLSLQSKLKDRISKLEKLMKEMNKEKSGEETFRDVENPTSTRNEGKESPNSFWNLFPEAHAVAPPSNYVFKYESKMPCMMVLSGQCHPMREGINSLIPKNRYDGNLPPLADLVGRIGSGLSQSQGMTSAVFQEAKFLASKKKSIDSLNKSLEAQAMAVRNLDGKINRNMVDIPGLRVRFLSSLKNTFDKALSSMNINPRDVYKKKKSKGKIEQFDHDLLRPMEDQEFSPQDSSEIDHSGGVVESGSEYDFDRAGEDLREKVTADMHIPDSEISKSPEDSIFGIISRRYMIRLYELQPNAIPEDSRQ